MEAVALRGPWRVCMIAIEIPNTFLESSDIVLSLVPNQNWFLKVDPISPNLDIHHLVNNVHNLKIMMFVVISYKFALDTFR